MIVLATAAIILLAIVPPTAAQAPAKKPNWHINDYWKYHGQFVFIVTVLIDVDLNVTGKGEVSVGPNTYSVFMLDFSIRTTLGTIESTVSGTDYFSQDDFSLIKTRSTTNDNGKLKTTEVTYDPPKREVNFPMDLGKEWEDNFTITTVNTVNGVAKTTVTNESLTYTVAAIESLDTSLGQMDCYRITAMNKTGNSINYWYSAQIGEFVKLSFSPALQDSYVTITDYQYAPGGGNGDGGGNSMMMIRLIAVVVVIVVVVVVVAYVATRKRSAVMVQQSYSQPMAGAQAGPAPIPVPVAQPIQPAPQPQAMIEDVFLVYRDGRLIHHDARRLKPEVDQDLLGGMLTAIQDFISRSFPSSDGTPGTVKEIRYANNRILLENGKYIYIAIVTDISNTAALQARMASLVRLIEVRCINGLAEWDGNLESLAEAKRLLRLILSDEPIPSQ